MSKVNTRLVRRLGANITLGLLCSVGGLATPCFAQVIHGSVVEALTGQPVSDAATLVRNAQDSIVASAVSDAAGRFSVRLSLTQPGYFMIASRRLGFEPRAADSVLIRPGDTLSVTVKLPRLAVVVDTVKTNENTHSFLTSVTSGREWFAQHMQAGKGQFLSGRELEWSQMTICDYFGRLDGLSRSYFDESGTDSTGSTGILCPDGSYLTSAATPHCLASSVDRVGPILKMWDDEFDVAMPVITIPSTAGSRAGGSGRSGGRGGGRGGGGRRGGSGGATASSGRGGRASTPDSTANDSTATHDFLIIHLPDIAGIEVYKDRTEIPADLNFQNNGSRKCALLKIWTFIAW